VRSAGVQTPGRPSLVKEGQHGVTADVSGRRVLRRVSCMGEDPSEAARTQREDTQRERTAGVRHMQECSKA